MPCEAGGVGRAILFATTRAWASKTSFYKAEECSIGGVSEGQNLFDAESEVVVLLDRRCRGCGCVVAGSSKWKWKWKSTGARVLPRSGFVISTAPTTTKLPARENTERTPNNRSCGYEVIVSYNECD